MGVSKGSDHYVGHSDQSSLGDALQDAVNQALADQEGADRMIDFEVTKIRGRAGGIAGSRDIWVEIAVGDGQQPGKGHDDNKEEPGKYTTLAVGEEGGGLGDHPGHDLGPGMSTRAMGEEGGLAAEAPASGDEQVFTTMAVGEEGGELAADAPASGDEQVFTTMAVGEEGG